MPMPGPPLTTLALNQLTGGGVGGTKARQPVAGKREFLPDRRFDLVLGNVIGKLRKNFPHGDSNTVGSTERRGLVARGRVCQAAFTAGGLAIVAPSLFQVTPRTAIAFAPNRARRCVFADPLFERSLPTH